MANDVSQRQTADCSLVGTLSPLHLSQNEVNLFEWARRDRVEAIKQLIEEKRCNLNVQDNFNRTPLHFAASNGNLNTVKLLVQAQAIVDALDKYGITPLMWAVYNNHKKVATYLLENGAKHTRVTKQGQTIIHFIAESNAIGILKYLYQKYHVLKVDLEDHAGLTPFLVAAHRGNQLLMEVFVKQGCFLTKKDKRGRTALHLASWKGHVGVVSYLLRLKEISSILNEVDNEGKTALYLATEANQTEIVAMLLRAGVDPNASSGDVDCSLILAAHNGFNSCIDALLVNGADRNARALDGNTPLHVAALANLPDTIYHLVGRGFPLASKNERGQTPLHLAVEQNKLESVEALLLAGSDLNIKDNAGLTPLEVGARASYLALVDMIIKADRWRMLQPVKAESVRLILTTLPDELPDQHRTSNTGTLLSPHERTSQTQSSYWTKELPGAYERGTGSSVSHARTLTGTLTASIISSRPLTNRSVVTSTTIQQLPAGFIDPYAMFPEPPGYRFPEYDTVSSVCSPPSVVESDDLSLGHEAATGWIRDSESVVTPSVHSQNGFTAVEDTVGEPRPAGYTMEERRLSNGEMIVSIYDPAQLGQNLQTVGAEEDGGFREEFTLIKYPQPCAEDMKIIFFKLSHEHLKSNDWKELANVWRFRPEHINAIEQQEGDKHIYKEHGYRLMSIWLFCLEPQTSPLEELCSSLTAIKKGSLAKKIRRKIDKGKKGWRAN